MEGVEAREVEGVEAWWEEGKGCRGLRIVLVERSRVDEWGPMADIGVWREGGVEAWYGRVAWREVGELWRGGPMGLMELRCGWRAERK